MKTFNVFLGGGLRVLGDDPVTRVLSRPWRIDLAHKIDSCVDRVEMDKIREIVRSKNTKTLTESRFFCVLKIFFVWVALG